MPLPVLIAVRPEHPARAGQRQRLHCICVGSMGSGKTEFINGCAEENNYSVGIDFRFVNYNNIRYQVFDTAGQERFRTLMQRTLSQADSVLIFSGDFQDMENRLTHLEDHLRQFQLFAVQQEGQGLALVPYNNDVNNLNYGGRAVPEMARSLFPEIATRVGIPEPVQEQLEEQAGLFQSIRRHLGL